MRKSEGVVAHGVGKRPGQKIRRIGRSEGVAGRDGCSEDQKNRKVRRGGKKRGQVRRSEGQKGWWGKRAGQKSEGSEGHKVIRSENSVRTVQDNSLEAQNLNYQSRSEGRNI